MFCFSFRLSKIRSCVYFFAFTTTYHFDMEKYPSPNFSIFKISWISTTGACGQDRESSVILEYYFVWSVFSVFCAPFYYTVIIKKEVHVTESEEKSERTRRKRKSTKIKACPKCVKSEQIVSCENRFM